MTHDINTYVDRIFYINMDKDVERNDLIVKQFNKHNIWNYERISGVVVNDIPPGHKIIGPIDPTQNREKYIKGSVGCLLSHKKIIEIALERGYSRICIFEDDAVFIENFEEQFNTYIDRLGKESQYQIAYLGLDDEDDIEDGRVIKRLEGHCFCTYGYILNDLNWVFKYILLNIDYQFQEIDLMYNSLIIRKDLAECYVSIPNLVSQNTNYASNIGDRK
jgi:GR25 family glycosyltransferase involved in LPS biosynthesis